MVAHTAWDAGRPAASRVCAPSAVVFCGRNGEKCLISRRGPMVLVRKVDSASAAEICRGDFSGCRIPGSQKQRRRWENWGGKREAAWDAAEEMVASSVGRH
jgi:hypothetical protein